MLGYPVKFVEKLKGAWDKAKAFFKKPSGGKTILAMKRTAVFGGASILSAGLILAWFGPKEDHTFYRQTSVTKKPEVHAETKPENRGAMATLFGYGQRKKEADQKREAEEKRKRIAIRYFAPQILGSHSKGPRSIKSGSKLIGKLMAPIDTRSNGIVRISLPMGGENSGIEIEAGSTALGQFSYSGSGDRVYVNLSRIDSPSGDTKRIKAIALDALDYTAGISGEEFTGNGVKVAATLGLTMFSGMTDTLTERESIGDSFNGVAAAPTMKDALLQGLSQASKDQAARTSAAIGQSRDYVVIPEGKEMIVELSEDFK